MLQKVEKNHHETFNYQGVIFLIHNPYELFSKRSAIHTTISNSTIAVYLDPQKTISDEVLNDYHPKKFEVCLNVEKIHHAVDFQTRLLSATRKTAEIFQEVHEKQLQI
jgi:hypothetical protein